jgi:hypothetical protein
MCVAAFGVVWTILLAMEGEFADSPGIMIFAVLICIGLVVVGVRLLRNTLRAKL